MCERVSLRACNARSSRRRALNRARETSIPARLTGACAGRSTAEVAPYRPKRPSRSESNPESRHLELRSRSIAEGYKEPNASAKFCAAWDHACGHGLAHEKKSTARQARARRGPAVALSHMWAHLREMRDALAALLGPRAQVGAEEVAPAVQPRAGVARLPTGAAHRQRRGQDPAMTQPLSIPPRICPARLCVACAA